MPVVNHNTHPTVKAFVVFLFNCPRYEDNVSHTARYARANLDSDSCETQHKQDKHRSGVFAIAVTQHMIFLRFDVDTVQQEGFKIKTHTQKIAFSLSSVTLLISLFNLETSLRALLICDWPFFFPPHFTWG